MRSVPAVERPGECAENALSRPIGTLPVDNIIASYRKSSSEVTVAIAVPDNTSPVPYKGQDEKGVLFLFSKD